jgi:hypothetical protein
VKRKGVKKRRGGVGVRGRWESEGQRYHGVDGEGEADDEVGGDVRMVEEPHARVPILVDCEYGLTLPRQMGWEEMRGDETRGEETRREETRREERRWEERRGEERRWDQMGEGRHLQGRRHHREQPQVALPFDEVARLVEVLAQAAAEVALHVMDADVWVEVVHVAPELVGQRWEVGDGTAEGADHVPVE